MITIDKLDPGLRSMILAAQVGGGASVFGKTYYVNSNGPGADAYDPSGAWGTNPQNCLLTIQMAINRCVADTPSKGDVIIVAPGHTESISTAGAISLSKAGITLIGLGEGDEKPTITFTNTAATVLLTAKNTTIYGFRFVSGVDSLVTFVGLNENYTRVINCDFVTSSANEALCFIACATTKDWFAIRGCTFYQPTDPAGTDGGATTGAIYIVDSEFILVEDCFFSGNFETAIFHNRTTACTNLFIRNCRGIQSLAGAEVIQLVSTASGGLDLSLFITPGSDDITEAKIIGTVPTNFFIGLNAGFGNDGAGGQLAVAGASAAS